MTKKIIHCFDAQASGAFAFERDDLLTVERPLMGEIIERRAFDGALKGLPDYLIDTALGVNTEGKAADLLISRSKTGQLHHHLVPRRQSLHVS